MAQCIICLKSEKMPSVEHVVGAALGSKYVLPDHICVCENCNGRMSKKFEEKFYSSPIVESYRASNYIKGRRDVFLKKVPFKLEEIDSGRKARIDNSGNYYRLVPEVSEVTVDKESGVLRINASLDVTVFSDHVEKVIKMAVRKCPEYKGKEDKIREALGSPDAIVNEDRGDAYLKFTIPHPGAPGLLTACKVAYELMWLIAGPDILRNSFAENIRKAIYFGDVDILNEKIDYCDPPPSTAMIDDEKANFCAIHSCCWIVKLAGFWFIGPLADSHSGCEEIKESRYFYFPIDGTGHEFYDSRGIAKKIIMQRPSI